MPAPTATPVFRFARFTPGDVSVAWHWVSCLSLGTIALHRDSCLLPGSVALRQGKNDPVNIGLDS